MRTVLTRIYTVVVFATTLSASAVDIPNNDFETTLQALELDKGICVILGQSEVVTSGYIMNLASNSELIFYFQSAEEDEVRAVRELADAAGLLGSRVFVDSGSTKEIHITENLADIVIATKDYEKSEVLRILNPSGKGFIAGAKIVKPHPKGIASWSHPLCGPDNNPVSQDATIRTPYQTQFVTTPRYGSVLQSTVSSGGRIFKAFGSYAMHKREELYLNTLVCFNAYNGIILWKRKLPEGFAVHRNTMVATPDTLYLGDDLSCKRIDARTGELKDEIIINNKNATMSLAWKWLVMEGNTLYALVGEKDKADKVLRKRTENNGKGKVKGWEPGFYNKHEDPWGHGQSIVAINPANKTVLWRYDEEQPIDGRATCMRNGQIYFLRLGSYIGCLDAKNGELLWRQERHETKASKLFEAFEAKKGKPGRIRWDTNIYSLVTDEVLLFSGTILFNDLIAVSTKTGDLLWSFPSRNAQILVSDDVVYVFSNKGFKKAKKLDLTTGEEIETLPFNKQGCSRVSASKDTIFGRTRSGFTFDYNLTTKKKQFLPMRPQCNEGVHISDGYLYWWPWFCDCGSKIFGVICITPTKTISSQSESNKEGLLYKNSEIGNWEAVAKTDFLDWPTLRKNNQCTSQTQVEVPGKTKRLWEFNIHEDVIPTAPITIGKTVIFGASNGAPRNKRINFYNKLHSLWAISSGVIVEDGVVYFASGFLEYDGSYVCALDGITGEVKWKKYNNYNVGGHLITHKNSLYVAGNGKYDMKTGKFGGGISSGVGSELFLNKDNIVLGGPRLYSDPNAKAYSFKTRRNFIFTIGEKQFAWVNDYMLFCFPKDVTLFENKKFNFTHSSAEFIDRKSEINDNPSTFTIVALNLNNGKPTWQHNLESRPVSWGMAVNRNGKTIISLQNGKIVCFGL